MSAQAAIAYPPARKGEVMDDYHGTKVPDPYRWLEDTDSPETRAWIEAENKITFQFLEQIPQRESIKRRLTQLWNYERFGVPFKEGGRYFFTRNDGLQNQGVLYTTPRLDAPPAVLLDPNKLSADGTVALKSYAFTRDGKLMAYGLSASGSDWEEWKIREVETGKDRGDHLQWVKFSGASWKSDGSGFYYSRYDKPDESTQLRGMNQGHKLYFHKLGEGQEKDVLVFESRENKDWLLQGEVTDDGHYLIITVHKGSGPKRSIFYQNLTSSGTPVVPLLPGFEAAYDFIGNEGPIFWFETDLHAPRGRVVAVDIRRPGKGEWREVIPQSADTLRSVRFMGGKFIADYMKDAHSEVRFFGQDGHRAGELELPGLGTAGGFTGRQQDHETFYAFTSFTQPGAIYRYDLASSRSTVFRQSKTDFDPSMYTISQVFFKSKDGTRVPMFITHKKGLKMDGNNPTYLYGYGGFDISLTPDFSPGRIAWMEMGGIYAQPNLRGGGEYGEDWHLAGTKLRKQNVFDDFIAAAEYLIEHKYTSPKKLAIEGRSNGGLLVGACMTQRPELYGACLPGVGVMDMLRFHKFTIGWAWVSDYGSSDNSEEFAALRAYSPLQNIRPGAAYPPTLITTADHDDRVVPGHSFKFAAALQAAQSGPNPALIRIDTKAGHGAGKPTAKVIEEWADKYAFLVQALGM